MKVVRMAMPGMPEGNIREGVLKTVSYLQANEWVFTTRV